MWGKAEVVIGTGHSGGTSRFSSKILFLDMGSVVILVSHEAICLIWVILYICILFCNKNIFKLELAISNVKL